MPEKTQQSKPVETEVSATAVVDAEVDLDADKPAGIVPTIGRIVHYKLSFGDAAQINKGRAAARGPKSESYQYHVGNAVSEGDVFPAMIVRTWGDTPSSYVNLQVFLDGADVFWATSRKVSDEPGGFAWPTRS